VRVLIVEDEPYMAEAIRDGKRMPKELAVLEHPVRRPGPCRLRGGAAGTEPPVIVTVPQGGSRI
jgi:hypothetical protein